MYDLLNDIFSDFDSSYLVSFLEFYQKDSVLFEKEESILGSKLSIVIFATCNFQC